MDAIWVDVGDQEALSPGSVPGHDLDLSGRDSEDAGDEGAYRLVGAPIGRRVYNRHLECVAMDAHDPGSSRAWLDLDDDVGAVS